MPTITLRVTDEELAQIDRQAKREGVDRSKFIRSRAAITAEWLGRTSGMPIATAKARLSSLPTLMRSTR
jgi:hypothetical protein